MRRGLNSRVDGPDERLAPANHDEAGEADSQQGERSGLGQGILGKYLHILIYRQVLAECHTGRKNGIQAGKGGRVMC